MISYYDMVSIDFHSPTKGIIKSRMKSSPGQQWPRSPPLTRIYSGVSRQNSSSVSSPQRSEEWSQYSIATADTSGTYRTKYEPQKSIHEDIAHVFSRPIRRLHSRGHEIPEPFTLRKKSARSPYRRPHTSGTSLPPCFSPIRPSDRARCLFTRPTSPQALCFGRNIPARMHPKKYQYPLNNIAYERPSMLATDIGNAMLPSGVFI